MEDVAVCIQGGLIEQVGPWSEVRGDARGEVRDLGDVVLVPALVNAHAHLELTALEGRLSAEEGFAAWIAQVGAYRLTASADGYLSAAREGARRCAGSGVGWVGDVTLAGIFPSTIAGEGLGGVLFLEMLGWAEDAVEKGLRRAEASTADAPAGMVRWGIGPHAPYTTSPALYQAASVWAAMNRWPLMTHAAETRAESEFVRWGRGGLVGIAEMTGWARGAGWQPPGRSPIAYLAELGLVRRGTVLVHVNYPEGGDLELISKCGASVAFCPRSHHYFGHDRYPLLHMLEAGVNVALGTDSLASNVDLSVLDEMRHVHSEFPGLPPEQVLWMGTVNAARALSLEAIAGEIAAGKAAALGTCAIPPTTKQPSVRDFALFLLEGGVEATVKRVDGLLSATAR